MVDHRPSGRTRVAVIGGGLVGAVTALSLSHLGFPVSLVDRQRPVLNKGALGIDIRNVALSPASRALLDKAGVWGQVEATPYHHMCIWEQWGTGVVHFDAAEAGVAELGWLVEMSPLVCAAWQCMATCPDIDVIEAGVTDVQPQDTGVELSLSSGEHHSFDFLIAADGAHSVVRQALGLGVLQQPLDQVAIATVVRTEASHQHTAWQRFLIECPLAFLPGA
jgi:2-polyprenyl-6-methoxyphenol hydroxylase-like FAD-dependent oxidoreductase